MSIVRRQILITRSYDHALLREVFHGIATYARQHTAWQLVCHAHVTAAELPKIAPAGIVAMTFLETEVRRWSRLTRTPAVTLLADRPDRLASTVFADEQAIGEMAVEHFVGMGLKHLAYVGYGDWPFVHQRGRGFAAAAAARGCNVISRFVGDVEDNRYRLGSEGDIKAMLQGMPRPCGLLAVNDILGVIIVRACRDAGLRVPEDLAILGVDNDKVACELSEVPLSSIVQPLFAIGYEGARIWHEQIEGEATQPTSLVLPPTRVVARASTDLIAVDDEDVATALRLIKDHFAEPINVAWVVDQIPVSCRSLYSRFLKVVGRTVLQQIHHVRLQKAKELLADSDLNLEIVARRSGFANRTWLTQNFRRELKTTPARYRRSFRIEC